MYYCALYKWWRRMAAMEHCVVTQRAAVPFLSLHGFVSLLTKILEGPGNTKVHGIHYSSEPDPLFFS